MLRIVPRTVPRVGRSYEHFPDGFELHLLRPQEYLEVVKLAFDDPVFDQPSTHPL